MIVWKSYGSRWNPMRSYRATAEVLKSLTYSDRLGWRSRARSQQAAMAVVPTPRPRAGGDVDALDLGGVVVGVADVHLELELAGVLVDVGPATGDEHADPAAVAVGVAGQGFSPISSVYMAADSRRTRSSSERSARRVMRRGRGRAGRDQQVGLDGVDELAAADLAGGRAAGADEGPQQLDRDPLAHHHTGQQRLPAAAARLRRRSGRRSPGPVLGPTWSMPRSWPSSKAPQRGLGPKVVRGAVVEDAAGDEHVPDRVAVQRLEGDRLVLAADGAHLEPGRSRRLPSPVVTAGPRPEHLSSG